ncbi:hypothetical protein GNI_012110 [Gregarina niphandrodes]|uniref:Uncharacterized protein n=1 Tax=Gregarina niphandrodes TaxID=110365 RepID=A0A023BCS6_GRENI|nr:hypothetical protein GNI_012110 [Gregarina niphandrodes]EZG85051.1 hypothetical protein GNI_012110 [Gregarina niphandrodes]|eukprot:XP_011128844.1 hypothetical protein GNI_012110 [Gregarina niphandrodes]
MRNCHAAQKCRWTAVILGAPVWAVESLPKDAGCPRERAFSVLSPEAQRNAVAGGKTPDPEQPSTTVRLAECSMDPCSLPLATGLAEPWAEAWAEQPEEAWPKSLVEVPREASREGPESGMPESGMSESGMLVIGMPESGMSGSGVETPFEAVVGAWGLLRDAWPECSVPGSMEGSVEARPEPATPRPCEESLSGAWASIVAEALEGLQVEACPPSSLVEDEVSLPNLVAEVLYECLEDEKDQKPALSPEVELGIVKLAQAGVRRELDKRKIKTDMSTPDFECCSWRWLKLALLMRELKYDEFAQLISALETLISRPIGLSDTWFMAGILQLFLSRRGVASWLPSDALLRFGWNCRKMIFRISFPDTVVRLPEREKNINRVCAISKLDWWFCQAKRNIIIDKNTWVSEEWPAALFRVQRALGKQTFDDAVQRMKGVIKPPLDFTNVHYLGCLIKYVETAPPKTNRRFPTTIREAVPSSSNSVPGSSSSQPSLFDEGMSIIADNSVVAKRSVAPEMTGFMARVLQECREKEKKCEESLMTSPAKLGIARFVLTRYRAVLSLKRKSEEKHRRSRIADPFSFCGWRWLCVGGLMNDYLKPELLDKLIADSEKVVPRPKHVSRLWYLACRLQTCLKGADTVQGFGCVEMVPAWWFLNTVIYRDHFPETFGELPMSKTSARLMAFTSKAAHWIATGIHKFRLSSRTWSPTLNDDIVDVFHKVLGDHWFSEMINIIKAKISQIVPEEGPQRMQKLSDKSIMETVMRYAQVGRRSACGFCNAWGFDVPKKRHDMVVDEDEPPTKKSVQ